MLTIDVKHGCSHYSLVAGPDNHITIVQNAPVAQIQSRGPGWDFS